MARYKTLDDIFNDPEFLELINVDVKPKAKYLDPEIEKFEEINQFYQENNTEPKKTSLGKERTLHNRLNGIRNSPERIRKLKPFDRFGLLDERIEVEPLPVENEVKYDSLDDFFNDAEDLFEEHIELQQSLLDVSRYESYTKRTQPDYIAKQRKIENFDFYEPIFKQVHREITEGKRQIIRIKNSQQIEKGDFFILKGVMLYVEDEGERFKSTYGEYDSRLSVVYENGKKSDMLKLSLGRALRNKDGYRVTVCNECILENSGEYSITTGYIYVLKSKSTLPQISEIKNLYKIGVTTNDVKKRLSNAHNEATYLYAPVEVVATFEIQNFNARKLETTLHHILAERQLNIDIPAPNGRKIKPKEWFIISIPELEDIIDDIMVKMQT